MSEIKETADKTLRGDVRKPLSLKRTVESGHVRQSFSHGRSKSVVVEKKKKRTISAPGGEAEEATAPEAAEAVVTEIVHSAADRWPVHRRGRRASSCARGRARTFGMEERERTRLEALKPLTPAVEEPTLTSKPPPRRSSQPSRKPKAKRLSRPGAGGARAGKDGASSPTRSGGRKS